MIGKYKVKVHSNLHYNTYVLQAYACNVVSEWECVKGDHFSFQYNNLLWVDIFQGMEYNVISYCKLPS